MAATLGQAVQTPEDVVALTESERRTLARWINLIDHPAQEKRARMRRLGVLVAIGGAVSLGPWIGLLIATLPSQHHTSAWAVAWIGFDVALTGAMAVTGWLGFRRRHMFPVALAVLATLFTTDAWFDVTLSWGSAEQTGSLLSAACVELPLAAFAAVGVYMLMNGLAKMSWRDQGRLGRVPRLSRVPSMLIRQTVEADPDAPTS
ncbi:hypothetical protein [Nocardioides jejuensis]|uniref:Uncharacterized protein n=1 Tax=Nocardioides jejuensis TaxID=2502782 RepID=A0A4R1CGX5_9ACTN|nr:hypothetical protein [Nocardioides jejuensis]TCJ30633.1 hypothetical protein EPD65_03470 [Nocardioides jejuensis]